jgi:hypothetical protein
MDSSPVPGVDEAMLAGASASGGYDRRRTKRLVRLLLCALIPSIGCGSTSTSTSVAPSPARCAAAATPSPSAFPASGGQGTLAVSSARECSWSVSSPVAWITLVPPTEGQGNGNVRYTVAANTAASARRGTLVLGSQLAEVTQEGAACRLELDPSSLELSAGEQTASVNVRAPSGCAWVAKAGVPWITVSEGAQGDGSGRVRIRLLANPATEPRSGSLQIGGVRVAVRQHGGAAPCKYDVDPLARDAGPEQTTGTFTVRADAGCQWTALSDQAWLKVVTGTSGNGVGDVQYQAARNTGASVRTGHITVNGTVFTVQQAACSYAVDPTSQSFEAKGGSGSIDVRTLGACTWSAETDASWIDITSGGTGSGDGRVAYSVKANTNIVVRRATISVAGQAFTVTQQAESSIAGVVASVKGSCPDKRFSVNGQRMRTTKSTDYEDGTCADLRGGVTVRVKGIIGSDDVLTAIEVDF